MARVHVLRLAAAMDQYLFLTGLEVEHCNLGISRRMASCAYREKHSTSSGQNEREQMIRFPRCRFRPRQYLWFAAIRGHAQKSGRRISRREDDGIVRAPVGSASAAGGNAAQRDRRSTGDGDFFKLCTLEETHPVPVGRNERAASA